VNEYDSTLALLFLNALELQGIRRIQRPDETWAITFQHPLQGHAIVTFRLQEVMLEVTKILSDEDADIVYIDFPS